jgi:hypothetical protein
MISNEYRKLAKSSHELLSMMCYPEHLLRPKPKTYALGSVAVVGPRKRMGSKTSGFE